MSDTEAVVERLMREAEREGWLGMPAVGRRSDTHPSTAVRWCLRGVRLPGGRRLRLEHVRLGGALRTTRPALVRFLAAVSAAPEAAPAPRFPAERRKAADRAGAELDQLLGTGKAVTVA